MLSRYRDFLPLTADTPIVDLGEGSTPLVKSTRIGPSLGIRELYFKLESCNPTGSFKDRGMVMAIAKALEEGSTAVLCASTGNTSASASAYAAHCSMSAFVFLPEGRTAIGKLTQSIAYGARVVAIEGTFDDALRLARQYCDRHPVSIVNSINQYRIQGQKTAAFELVDDLGEAPDRLFIPVGNAGNITAYWMGFKEYQAQGLSTRLPRMMGFQAAGAAPIVRNEIVEDPQTVASAIRIGNPASWQFATEARDQSQGDIDSVTDDEIIAAYQRMATEEGLFCEPASAASVAGLIKASEWTDFTNETCVCVITGMGLKDPDTAAKAFPFSQLSLPADLKAIEDALADR